MNGLQFEQNKQNDTYEYETFPGVRWNICKECGRLKIADGISRCVMAMKGFTFNDHVCKEK